MKSTPKQPLSSDNKLAPCYNGCFYYNDSCFKDNCKHPDQGDHTVIRTPFHKQTDTTKLPGQVKYHEECSGDCHYAAAVSMPEHARAKECQYEKQEPKAATYKPVHGGYPDVRI